MFFKGVQSKGFFDTLPRKYLSIFPWELGRNAESQAPPQTYSTRICILTRSPGDPCVHYTVRSSVWGARITCIHIVASPLHCTWNWWRIYLKRISERTYMFWSFHEDMFSNISESSACPLVKLHDTLNLHGILSMPFSMLNEPLLSDVIGLFICSQSFHKCELQPLKCLHKQNRIKRAIPCTFSLAAGAVMHWSHRVCLFPSILGARRHTENYSLSLPVYYQAVDHPFDRPQGFVLGSDGK